ncbi:hypothetical protein P153DRAFT_385999 [Dothidotthia symphoricarpi CBS 119687]|uniref:SCP domain-containing protein n=1 Tax=Dothidotthia symphoricarpi CBS 119687 TaxID=1392245 RepID=A0A6A6AB43_9PLEO|nr:uncharacterized protein P153DRAFT_385999 [Dothidotthia symphoricarpi CBS 119687]KAF2128796.1 hypothetical protein P153DRAFT_385999 [Dothidotthia symphoricarpi CBS 119687]
MRTAFALSVAALAASVFAAPAEVVHVVVETQLQTVYVTEGYSAPTAAAVYEAPAAYTTVVYEHPTYTRTRRTRTRKPATATPVYTQPATSAAPVYTQAPTTSAAPTTLAPVTSAAPTSSAAPAATGTGYMAVVDTWRSKMGLSALAQDSKLEANAKDCVVSSAGTMVHKLNPGSYGQVLAPGNADDFEHVFVGGWLCEIPTLAGLDGVCTTQSVGWSYEGQTGHAEILTSASYSKIGCALFDGIWACDLA